MWFNGIIYQGGEQLIGSDGIFDGYVQYVMVVWIYGGFLQLIWVYFVQIFIVLDGEIVMGFFYQLVQGLFEVGYWLMMFVVFDVSIFFYQVVQFFVQGINMMIFWFYNEFVIQWIVGIYVVGMYVNNWFKMLQFFVFVEIEFLLVVVLFFFVQFGDQGVYLVGYFLFVCQVGFGQGWLIDKFFQQCFWEVVFYVVNYFLGGIEFGNQFFQWFVCQCWCIGVGVQGCIVECDGDLILIYCFVVFNVLFLFVFFYFVQWWLGNVDVVVFDDFWYLMIEEG